MRKTTTVAPFSQNFDNLLYKISQKSEWWKFQKLIFFMASNAKASHPIIQAILDKDYEFLRGCKGEDLLDRHEDNRTPHRLTRFPLEFAFRVGDHDAARIIVETEPRTLHSKIGPLEYPQNYGNIAHRVLGYIWLPNGIMMKSLKMLFSLCPELFLGRDEPHKNTPLENCVSELVCWDSNWTRENFETEKLEWDEHLSAARFLATITPHAISNSTRDLLAHATRLSTDLPDLHSYILKCQESSRMSACEKSEDQESPSA